MFASNLRRLRLTRGYARARQFAQALGINENRYTRYERGQAEPPIGLIYSMCDKLGVTPNALFGIEIKVDAGSRPHASEAPAQPAFGEDPSPFVADDAMHSPADAAVWRLARSMVAVRPRDKHDENARSGDPLEDLRAVTAAVATLQADPFGAIRRLVTSPQLEAQPRHVQARIGAEIDRCLSILLDGDADAAAAKVRSRRS